MIPLLSPRDGLDRELALLGRVASGDLPWGLLQWRAAEHGLVVPRSTARLERFPEAAGLSAAEGWPVATRESGGGVVPLSPGVLTVAIAFIAPSIRIEAAFHTLCAPLVEALAAYGVDAQIGWVPGAFCDGAYNLVVEGRKIAGTAQRWRRARLPSGERADAVLAHAMLLVDDDLDVLVGAVDRFAVRCGIEAPRLEQHVTLAQLVPDATPDGLAARVEQSMGKAFAAYGPNRASYAFVPFT
jgi:lipoate-protein ligase A